MTPITSNYTAYVISLRYVANLKSNLCLDSRLLWQHGIYLGSLVSDTKLPHLIAATEAKLEITMFSLGMEELQKSTI